MRIAFITETYPPEINGVSLTVERTVRFLRKRGHDLDLIRPSQDHEEPMQQPRQWLTHGLPLPMYPDLRFGLARVASLKRRFEWHQPELVHMATPGPLAWAAMSAAHQLGIPTSTDFRTNFHAYSRYYRMAWLSPLILKALRGFHNRADRTYVPTPAMQKELRMDGFARLEVVGRGVDTTHFHPKQRSDELRQRFVGRDGILMLYVGRLAGEKNVSLALEAFEAVRTNSLQSAMVVVGDGPQRAALQRRHPQAHFVGMQRGQELARYYASADFFLFPSLTDTFGNVVPEALASGLPVLAFDMGAAAELMRNGGAGKLIAPNERDQFIAAACQLAWQHRHMAAMREQARAIALTARWDRVLTHFETSLMEVAYAIPNPRAGHTRTA